MKSTTKKKLYLELMRIIAIFFVLYNHTDGFLLYTSQPVGSFGYWTYMILSNFCKFAVPLFMAVSGALMLGRDNEPLSVLWKKKILKFAGILLVFSALYYTEYIVASGFSISSIKNFFATTYSGTAYFHLWYMYMYLAYLICVPFLRALVKNLDTKYFYYMIVIAAVLKTLPIAELVVLRNKFTLSGNIRPEWLVSDIVLYPCIGYFLEHRVDIKKAGKKLHIFWGVSVLCMVAASVGTYFSCEVFGLTQKDDLVFRQNYAFVICITVYLTVKYICTKYSFSASAEKIICILGECTFGVYLLHPMVEIDALRESIFGLGINRMVAVWIYIPLWAAVSYAAAFVLKKIPVLKKLVGG